jgi:hypothetical protein
MITTAFIIPSRKLDLFSSAYLTGSIEITLFGHYLSALGLLQLFVLGIAMLAQQVLCMTSVNESIFPTRRPSSTPVPPQQVCFNATRKDSDVSIKTKKSAQREQNTDRKDAAWAILQRKSAPFPSRRQSSICAPQQMPINVTRKDSDVSIKPTQLQQCEKQVDAEEAVWTILQRKDSAIDGIEIPSPSNIKPTVVHNVSSTRHVTWSTTSSFSTVSFNDPFEATPEPELPADYKQAFVVKRDCFCLHQAACSSSTRQHDLCNVEDKIDAILSKHDRPTITISPSLAYSNFPLLCNMSKRAVNGRSLRLSGCETLYIDIDVTTATSFDLIRQVRLNVESMVRILNASSKAMPLPKLHIGFSSAKPSSIRASHFAVAMGPLHRLENLGNVTIAANQALNPHTGFHVPIFRYKSNRGNRLRAARFCTALTDCMTSQHPSNAELISQQLIFDIKMELLHIESQARLELLDFDSSDEEPSTSTKETPSPSDDEYDSSATSSSEKNLYTFPSKRRSTILPQPSKPQSARDRLYSRLTCFDTMPASIARRIDLALADLHDLYFPLSRSTSTTTISTASSFSATTQRPGAPPPRWLLPLQTAMRLTKPSYEILTLMANEMFPGAAFANARAWIAGNWSGEVRYGSCSAASGSVGSGEMGFGGEERRFSI